MLLRSLALACAVLILAAVPASAGSSTISMRDDAFRPGVKAVAKGAKVVWVNRGRDKHTVTTRKFSVVLDPGERYSKRVRHGFRYVCAYHGAMKGRVKMR